MLAQKELCWESETKCFIHFVELFNFPRLFQGFIFNLFVQFRIKLNSFKLKKDHFKNRKLKPQIFSINFHILGLFYCFEAAMSLKAHISLII